MLRRLPRTLTLVVFLLALIPPALAAQSQRTVRQITIHSGWGGLGSPQNGNVIIRQEKGKFQCDGKVVDASLVEALVTALQAPAIAKPDLANLGVTPAWLEAHAKSAEQQLPGRYSDATASQKAFFSSSFTDLGIMAKVVPQLFEYARSDDNPYVEVEVVFEDGSTLSAKSHSYYDFLIPWTLSENGQETFNANISRALSFLMPPHTVNKERLEGGDFVSELVRTLMQDIKPDWNLRGVESRAGEALSALRSVYMVEGADINPNHNVEYGKSWQPDGPYETNLHATLHKSTMPANVFDELILLYDHDKVKGVQEFLSSGAKYEAMALSVPWFKDYIQQHPNVNIYIFQVHGASFGEHAMETFALDMKARGREDLIEEVQSQQSQITLLKIGDVDWLLFPDRHMMLWRFDGPSGFLKWAAADFPRSQCGSYRSNYEGCSGREVDPAGTLAAEHIPRDQACMHARSNPPVAGAPQPDDLFPVMDHDRAGFIDRTGRLIIPLCFDKAGDFSEGLARFERDGRWGYIDANGSVVIEPRFPWAQEFSEGLARVQVSGESLGIDGRWGFIDKTGKVVILPDYKGTFGRERNIGSGSQEDAFHDGLAMIQVDGKTGYIDQTGQVVIPPEFTSAYPFAEGLAAATTQSTTGNEGWGYIDKTGKWVIAPQFSRVSSFQEHLATVQSKTDCGYIDLMGAYVLKLPMPADEKDKADVCGDFVEGLAWWKIGNKYGFIDRSGKVVIEPKFDIAFRFSEGLAAVRIGDNSGYIDKTGKLIIELEGIARAEDFHHGLAFVSTKDHRYGYIDRLGHYAWAPTRLYND